MSVERRRVLWFAILAAPLAWATQLVSGYAIEEGACPADRSVEVATVSVTAAAAGLAVVGALVAYRCLRSADAGGPTRAFLAVAAFAGSLLCLAAIGATGLSLLSLDACRQG